jgi:hypothetical protein
MTLTFADAKRKLLRLLEDETVVEEITPADPLAVPPTLAVTQIRGAKYDAELLKDAVHAGLDAVLNRLWKSSKFSITTAGSEFDAPTDLIEVEAVREVTLNVLLPRLNLTAGGIFTDRSGNAWTNYPEGKITFANPILASSIEVFYSAAWAKPTLEADVFEVPAIAHTAVLLFSASYCLLSESAGAARLRQYNTRVDSGNPTDNPLENLSTLLLKRYEVEIQRIPQKQKGSY